MTLRARAIRAVRWTGVSAVLRGGLQVLQLAVLARLLLPSEFGLVAAAAAVVSIGSLVADLGVNSAYLQARDVSEAQRSALYLLNVLSGLLLTLLVVLISPLGETGLGDPRIPPLLRLYALIFFITSLGGQLRYDAEKRLDFRAVAMIEVAATTSGVSIAVVSAVCGSGAFALVYGALTAAIANTILNWIFLARGWRPRLDVPLKEAWPFLPFGIAVIGNGVVTQLSTTLDMLIGGRLLGASQFGLYAAPRNLFLQVLSLVNPIVTRVGFPLVAHLENDRERIARVYLKTLSAVVGINAPIFIGAAVLAEPIVTIVFGHQWAASVPVFRVLALWALCRCVMNPVGNLLLGQGRPDLALKWNAAQLVLASLVLPYSANFGNVGLALAMLGIMLLQLLPGWFILVRPLSGIPLRGYILAIMRPTGVALAAVGIAAVVVHAIPNLALKVGLAVFAAAVAHIAGSWLTREAWLTLFVEQLGIR